MVDVDGREAEGLRGCAAAAVASHFTSGEEVLFYFRHFTSDVFLFLLWPLHLWQLTGDDVSLTGRGS